MNDGSSSAKTMDERELFLVITAETGIPAYAVLSLAEVEDANAEGLSKSLKSSFTKVGMTIDHKHHEVGMCSDGAPVNVKLHCLIKDEIGEHYPAHTTELSMHDAFKKEPLNVESENDYVGIYYFFRRLI